jgi:hypothetical protein
MSTIAYTGDLAATAAEAKPARKGWFARFIAALQESRMKQAQREIAYYRHLLPRDMEWAGDHVNARNEDQLPFTR